MSASLLATAVVAFLGTTVDDLIILTALFLSRRTSGRPAPWSIIGGQYTGFAAILATALLAATGLRVVPDRWVGLLGLVPIGLGLWDLWRLRGRGQDAPPPLATGMARIAVLTFANGADNIGVFTPLFRGLHAAGSLLATTVFLLLIGIWCVLGLLLGSHRLAVATLGRIRHWFVPAVFVVVGVLILITSGTLTALRDLL